MNKKFILILIILFLITVWGLHFYQKKNSGDVLTLYGNIDIREVNLGFRVPGRVSAMNFEEGDVVKPSEIMAVLDKKPYQDALALAQGELKNADANFLKLRNGSRPQEIASAEAVVKEREAAYQNALMLEERKKCIKNTGAIARQEFNDTTTATDEAFARLKDAKEKLGLAIEGFRYEDIKAAEAQLETAKARVEAANTNLQDTQILCPNEGTILTRVREPGAVVNAGASVYTLSIKEPVWVRTYVDEVNLGKIYPGMKAKIYMDARPDAPYEGRIGFISPISEFTPKNVETASLRTSLVYRIRVVIDKTDKYLRQGMPVTVKLNLKGNNKT